MADYKERDAFPEVPDYKVNIGDNLDGGSLSVSDIYSPKAEPALVDNVLDPSEEILKEIVVLIDEFGKKTLKKSFSKELRVGNSMGSTDGTNASALRGTGVAKQTSGVSPAVAKHHKNLTSGKSGLKGLLGMADDGEPKKSEFGMCSKGHSHKDQEDFDLCAKAIPTASEAVAIKSISKFLKG